MFKTVSRRLIGKTPAERAGRSLILATFLSATGFTSVFSLLPLYMHQLVGQGPGAVFWAGLAMAATPMAGAVVSPLWGKLADRFGYRPMLLRACLSTAPVTLLMAIPDAPWQLVLLRALAGALGSFQPAAMGALSSWSRPEDLSRAIGRLQMAQIAGAIAGPLLGGGIATLYGIRAVPIAGGLVISLGALMVARWFHEPKSKRALLRGSNQPLRPTLLWLPMLTLVAIQFTDGSFNPILPLLLAQGEPDPSTVAGLVGLAAAFNATAAAVGSNLSGHGFKRGVKPHTVVVVTSLLAALALSAAAAPLPWGLVLLRIACGGLAGGLAVAAFSAGGMAVLPGQRGSAYGWLASASSFGYATSPIVAGAMAAIDLRAVLLLDVVFCLLTTVGWRWAKAAVPTPASATPASTPTQPAAPTAVSAPPEEGLLDTNRES